jgi:diguanylate cyclase (GGDEF)-like protein/PAS domain S-box-containing protein
MTPAIRISFGIVSLTTTLLFAADWALEIFPDPYGPALEARLDISESLAIQYSSLVTADQLPDMQRAMESMVEKMPDVLSMNLRKWNGDSIAATSEHAVLWNEDGAERSTPTQVLIPIFGDQKQWGVLQVKFDALPHAGFWGLLSTPLYKLIAVMAACGFLVYLVYLSRTLSYLDPSKVVPSRVRAALDQLVEGVFVLDDMQRIVLVNSSFAQHMSLSPDALMGADPSGLPWVKKNAGDEFSEMPWEVAIRLGVLITDERLELQSPELGIRVFKANVSPIIDGDGKQRGVLASFNDISELERMNEGLRDTLENLEVAHDEVRNKNDELFRLATIDPLTECFNRRAFFEKLEIEFDLAVRDKLKLSVVMADIDHFKRINDDFGHGTGDVVIKDMARALTDVAGVNGCVGRYGGEEFCILLVGADENEAITISNRARLAFQALYGASDSVTKGRVVTASFGVSTICFGAKDVAEILDQSDVALYESKNNGRNCATSWMAVDANKQRAS